jgi:hypothetical protein
MSKHTQGPWAYRPNEHDDWGMLRAADGMPVARSFVEARNDGTRGHDGPEEIKANGLLIAAAPELLDACKNALAIAASGLSSDRLTREDAMKRIRDAVDKATGGAAC